MNSIVKIIIGAIVVFLLVAAVVKYKNNKEPEANIPTGSNLTDPDPEEDNESRTPADPNTELDPNSIYKG